MAFGTLLTQIRTAYTGDADLSGALNAFNFVDVIGSPAFPYGTYHYISGSGGHTAAESRIVGSLIQFNLFDKGSNITTLADAYDKLIAVYDELNVQSGGRAYKFVWEGDWVIKENDVWQISCRYRVFDHPA